MFVLMYAMVKGNRQSRKSYLRYTNGSMVKINPDSKRFKSAVRFFTYGVMTTAVIGLSALVILLSLGYRFNKDLTIIREGLVQLGNRPAPAKYSIDGKQYESLTPTKATLPEGDYTFELSQDGYRPWKKQLHVIAGHVHWLDYARLIPTTLHSTQKKDYKNVLFAQASPDKRWMALYSGEKKNEIELIDLRDPAKPVFTTLTIPESQLTKVADSLGTLQFVEWSLDSKQLLLKHQNGDTAEYVRLDRTRPQEAININKRFQLSLNDVHFSGGDTNIVYSLTGDVLRKLDITANTASGVLLSGIRSYEVYGDNTIVYSRNTKKQDGTEIVQTGLHSKDKDTIIGEYPAGSDVIARYTEYDHHAYFIVANRSQKQVKLYRDPLDQSTNMQVFAQFEDMAPEATAFSPTSRFLTLRQGEQMGVYDFYEQQQFTYVLPVALDASTSVKWLDGYRMSAVLNGKLTIWEFDGTNKQELAAQVATRTVTPLLDEDDDYLYTIVQSATDQPFQLMSTDLRVKR